MPVAQRRVRQPEVRPDQILDAAEQVLLARDDGAMTMDAVATAAGVGKGTVYHYYASKADVLAALRARWVERTVADAEGAASARRPRTELQRIERFLEALLDATVRDGQLIWILFHLTATEEENELAGVYDSLLARVRVGVESNEFRVPEPEFTTQFLLNGFHGVVESAIHRGDLDPKRVMSAMRATLRALLTAA